MPYEEAFKRAKKFIGAGLADGSFPLFIDKIFTGIDALLDAMRTMGANEATGKIVVTL